jgi:uncharacterized protein with HEPN domain
VKLSMSHDHVIYLEDIKESCEKISRYTKGMNFDQFVKDDKTYDAVLRNLEIIGEAVKHLPDAIRERYPEVEWRKMAGLRDVVAHAYFGIHDEIIWDVLRSKIPALLVEVSSIIEQEKET